MNLRFTADRKTGIMTAASAPSALAYSQNSNTFNCRSPDSILPTNEWARSRSFANCVIAARRALLLSHLHKGGIDCFEKLLSVHGRPCGKVVSGIPSIKPGQKLH